MQWDAMLEIQLMETRMVTHAMGIHRDGWGCNCMVMLVVMRLLVVMVLVVMLLMAQDVGDRLQPADRRPHRHHRDHRRDSEAAHQIHPPGRVTTTSDLSRRDGQFWCDLNQD